MENTGIMFIGTLCLIWLFIKGSQPIEFIKIVFDIDNESDSNSVFKKVLKKLVNCALCSGFWIGLLDYFQLIPDFLKWAALIAVCAEIWSRLYDFVTNKI